MDDFIILHKDKNYLNICLKEIEKYLNKYKLKLNENKTRIDNIKTGISFLGYRFIIENKKVIINIGNRTKKNFKRRIRKILILKNNSIISDKEIKNLLSGYIGIFKRCRSNYVRDLLQV